MPTLASKWHVLGNRMYLLGEKEGGGIECIGVEEGREENDSLMTLEELAEYEAAEKDMLLIQRVEAEVLAESGVALEELINPSKVITLEREIASLTETLKETSDAFEINEINEKLSKKQKILTIEKRAVMRGWLKGLFVAQSVIALVVSLVMVIKLVVSFPPLTITHPHLIFIFKQVYNGIPGQISLDLPLPIQVLGFWTWWLFIIPSLRARKPGPREKEALNYAFLSSPIIRCIPNALPKCQKKKPINISIQLHSILMPSLTKDTALIWWGNFGVTVACYLYAYFLKGEPTNEIETDDDDNLVMGKALEQPNFIPRAVIQAFKALDYGSGQERGVRK